MNKSYKVKATKHNGQPAREKAVRAGKPYKGANLVVERPESGKKNAKKTAAARRATAPAATGGKKK